MKFPSFFFFFFSLSSQEAFLTDNKGPLPQKEALFFQEKKKGGLGGTIRVFFSRGGAGLFKKIFSFCFSKFSRVI